MGWGNAGWHNKDNVVTPNMDSLVENDAVELDRHYVFFYCSPTRSSLLSGRYPAHVSEDNGNACTLEGAVPRNMTTIASKLQRAGWKTHQIGKWHLGQIHNGSIPASRGFDSSYGYLGGAEDHYLNTNGGCGNCGQKPDLWRTNGPAIGENNTGFMAYKYNTEALKLINEHAAEPGSKMFMYLALQCAHAPNEPDTFANLYSSSKYTEDYINYNGMISAVDSVVGNVSDTLKSTGLWESTLLIFTSDNGGPSAKSVSGHSANNYPLRGGKHTAWEGGHRVLAFVTGGVIPASMRGKKLEGFIHGADWYATIAGLAGVDPSDSGASGMPATDSIDQWDYISGAQENSSRTELLLASAYAACAVGGKCQHGTPTGSAALIMGNYKLVRNSQQYCFWMGPVYPNASTDHKNEADCTCGSQGCLFDIFADPGEHHDLSTAFPDIATKLRNRAEELDKTSIEAIKGPTWRGQGDPKQACADAMNKYSGFWGPDLFP